MPIFQTIHIGGGLRNYTTVANPSSSIIVKANYFDAQGAFDAVIVKDVKFYTEMAMQKLGVLSSSGIDRPINAGITIPTFGVVDTLAVEAENVAKTFFSNSSVRDPLGAGREKTPCLSHGVSWYKKNFSTRSTSPGDFTPQILTVTWRPRSGFRRIFDGKRTLRHRPSGEAGLLSPT